MQLCNREPFGSGKCAGRPPIGPLSRGHLAVPGAGVFVTFAVRGRVGHGRFPARPDRAVLRLDSLFKSAYSFGGSLHAAERRRVHSAAVPAVFQNIGIRKRKSFHADDGAAHFTDLGGRVFLWAEAAAGPQKEGGSAYYQYYGDDPGDLKKFHHVHSLKALKQEYYRYHTKKPVFLGVIGSHNRVFISICDKPVAQLVCLGAGVF